jgi:hypothetical protein
MSRAGSDAGPEQTEELISNTKCVGAPVATFYPDYASSRTGPALGMEGSNRFFWDMLIWFTIVVSAEGKQQRTTCKPSRPTGRF